ncbi:MAG: PilZ domain-containing protein [Pseudomonadota bacterium]
MEQRRYPRIQVPLLVELKHPTTGTLRCMARDISEGGIFVQTDNPQLKPGAKVKLTLLNTLGVEAQPTPTVDMEVKRVEDRGLGLAFTSVVGRHLWESVERMRTELAIGRDYFQVHVNVLVVNTAGAVLLAQQHGRWTFPATFLVVGEDWQVSVRRFLNDDFAVEVDRIGAILGMNTVTGAELPEAAVLDLFVEAGTHSETCELADTSRYRSARWIDRRRQVEETTFVTEQVRALAEGAVERLATTDEAP